MSSNPTGDEPTAPDHADLDRVQHLIDEAKEAEEELHRAAPYQLETEDDYVPNGFDPSDHKPETTAHTDASSPD